MAAHKIVLISGDGIGPEITDAVLEVLAAAGAEIEWIQRQAGITALDESGYRTRLSTHREMGVPLRYTTTTQENHRLSQGKYHEDDRRVIHAMCRADPQTRLPQY